MHRIVAAPPVGRALCIGVSPADPVRYANGNGRSGAEADARALAGVAAARGFARTTLLLGADAVRTSVRAKIDEAARTSRAGDLFLLTFSGHGGQKKTVGGNGSGVLAGAWSLYDGSFIDPEIHAALSAFKPRVRVLVISDCCNGGIPGALSCAMLPLAASVLVLTACQSDQYADADGLPGHFTTAVLNAWKCGTFAGTYRQFHETILARMPSYQRPGYYWVGPPDARFEAQRPFAV